MNLPIVVLMIAGPRISFRSSGIGGVGNDSFLFSFILVLFSTRFLKKDPFDLSGYVKNCVYLPDLNNEKDQKTASYKKNILGLKNFVMGMSSVDMVLLSFPPLLPPPLSQQKALTHHSTRLSSLARLVGLGPMRQTAPPR